MRQNGYIYDNGQVCNYDRTTAEKILTESSSVGLEKAAKNNKYEAKDTAYNKKDTSMDKTLIEALNALKEGET